jgi:sigma-B regulation protein RsbU (phosphoserine phosphatase)
MKNVTDDSKRIRFRFQLEDRAADLSPAPSISWDDLEFDYAAISRPAKELPSNFLETESLAHGKVVFAIGDNALPSDTLPVLCIRHYLRRSLLRDATSPIQIARRISELIYDCCPANCSVSCFYGQYSRGTGVLRYINAGHDAPLLIRRNPDEVLRLEQSGPVFGLQESPRYVEGHVQLRNGDRLIAFTHGIIDSLAAQIGPSAEHNLISLVRRIRNSSAVELANRIVAECQYLRPESRLDQSVFVAAIDEIISPTYAGAAMHADLLPC